MPEKPPSLIILETHVLQNSLDMPRPDNVQSGDRLRHARYGSPSCLLQIFGLGLPEQFCNTCDSLQAQTQEGCCLHQPRDM